MSVEQTRTLWVFMCSVVIIIVAPLVFTYLAQIGLSTLFRRQGLGFLLIAGGCCWRRSLITISSIAMMPLLLVKPLQKDVQHGDVLDRCVAHRSATRVACKSLWWLPFLSIDVETAFEDLVLLQNTIYLVQFYKTHIKPTLSLMMFSESLLLFFSLVRFATSPLESLIQAISETKGKEWKFAQTKWQ